MSKYIDLQFSCPPSLDFPTYVGTQDEGGQPITVGTWIPPGDVSPFWVLRLTPAEVLMYMIADGQTVQAPNQFPGGVVTPVPNMQAQLAPAPSARAALRAKLAGAKPRRGAPVAAAIDPSLTDKCPACGKLFNPATHELLDCPGCGEGKCTLNCFGSTAEPCKDCLALVPDPDDGGYEPPAADMAQIKTPELREAMQAEARGAAAAVGSRLFDNVHHGRGGQDSEPADDDE